MIVFSHDNFVPNLKLIVMKKIIFFLSALLLPFFAFEMSADDKTAVIKIPLKIDVEQNLNRSLVQDPIESCYYGMNQSVFTTVYSDLGIVHLTITNTSTGEVWYDTFDSGASPQVSTMISGTPGYYEVVYVVDSGISHNGSFIIQ